MRLLLALTCALLAALALSGGQAAADPDANHGASGVTSPSILALISNDDLFATTDLVALTDPLGANHTQHYGPYTGDSPDSGTCGNDWATDTFERHFTVRSNRGGTFTVIEQFKNGSFVTNAGPSPGSCDVNDGSPPGTLDAAVAGSMHGYFIVSDVGPQTSHSAYCDALTMSNTDCTTETFINTHFTPCYPAACQVTTFFDHYSAGDQGLVEHEWKNASEDRGGNHGDIRSTNVP